MVAVRREERRDAKFRCYLQEVLRSRRLHGQSGTWLAIYIRNQTHLWTNSRSRICLNFCGTATKTGGLSGTSTNKYSERGDSHSCGLWRRQCQSDGACINFRRSSMERYTDTGFCSKCYGQPSPKSFTDSDIFLERSIFVCFISILLLILFSYLQSHKTGSSAGRPLLWLHKAICSCSPL